MYEYYTIYLEEKFLVILGDFWIFNYSLQEVGLKTK